MEPRGKKVTLVGMGDTAVSAAKLLLREGARVFVTESKTSPKIEERRAALEAIGASCETGGHSASAFEGASLIVTSPGVSPEDPVVHATGLPVTGEMELAFPYCRSRIIAVTGTNGKTTTTELLRALVAACGHSVLLAGNNALPFSEAVLAEPAPEYIVLEVSSYQLEPARAFRPWAAAVLNVTPDHLKRHKTVENYAAVKAKIYSNQGEGDIAVVNVDDAFVRAMAPGPGSAVWPFSVSMRQERGLWLDGDTIRLGDDAVATTGDTPLRGLHNMENVLCALSIMRAGGFDWARVLEGLRAFRGVEHRIEFVATISGADFYNDSKSTNIDSLKVALKSFEAPVVLIAGGEGKGSDYGVLRELVSARVRALVTIGQDAPLLEAAFGELVPTERASDMDDAVRQGAVAAGGHGAVLLSPACASFDMYDNFEHRGHVFKESVRRYAEHCKGRSGT